MFITSVQSGEGFAIWGSNTLGMLGTPPDVVATLSKAITEVLAEKDIQQRHRELGLEVSPTPGDQLAKRMRSESDRWGKVINESGIEQQ